MSAVKEQVEIRDRIKELRRVKASELIPDPRNPRRHPDHQAAALSGLLREIGYSDALLARETPEGLKLIDGHLRQKLTPDSIVPVLVLDVTEQEANLLLASIDPLSALATYDKENLDALLHDVSTSDAAVAALLSSLAEDNGLYFGEPKTPVVEHESAAAELVDRAAELQKKWNVQRGQIWEVGRHRLMCGDSSDRANVERFMDGERVNAVLTDPIYGINQKGVPGDEPEGFEDTIYRAVENLPCDDAVVVAFQSTRTFPTWLDAVREHAHKFERMLWMYKAAQCTFPWRGWILTSESILVSTKGEGYWQDVHPYSHDCYYLPEVSGELDESIGWHGSVKPLKVVTDILVRICAETQSVFDGFLGSGTTMVAAEHSKRICYGMDKSEGCIAVTLERLTSLGMDAKLAN